MNDIIPSNQLSVVEHVTKIRGCLERTRQSIFDTVISIKECKEQVGDDVFQKDVSEMLGMSPSTLNRWISIGNSEFILQHQNQLPHTFSSLYNISQLEKRYSTYYPKDAYLKLEKLIENGDISLTSQQSDIGEILKKIDDKIKLKSKKEREEKLLGLEDGLLETETKSATMVDLISENKKFRSFVVNLPNELIQRWGDEGTSELDIMEEFPLHDLRPPSISEVVTCLLIVPMNKIDVGIKVLSSFGFTYRDSFVPHQTSPDLYRSNLQRLTTEKVVLRGERGFSGNPPSNQISSSNVKDVVGWVGDHLTSPYCLVFDKTDVDGWVCLTR
jgi:hypothetical protein